MKQAVLIMTITLGWLTLSLNSAAQGSKKQDPFDKFILPSYEVLDAATGDLNGDGYPDYALVLKSGNEDNNGDELRPLLLITGSKNGTLTLLARNDSIVLCRSCGGFFGDPFEGVNIEDGLLSVEHNVGGTWRWSRNISFRYDRELEDLVLEKDVALSYRQFSPARPAADVAKKEEKTKQLFRQYSSIKSK